MKSVDAKTDISILRDLSNLRFKIKFSNDLEQIKKIKVKTSEDVLPSFRENRES